MIELLDKREYHAKHFDMEVGETFKSPKRTYEENPEDITKPIIKPVLDVFGNQVWEDIVVQYDGQYKKYQPHVGHIHYKGTDNSWKEIDFSLEDMGTYWQMTKHSYKLLIAKDFGGNKLIRFQNRYRGANHQIDYEPRMLAWVNNPDLSDVQVFRQQQSVQGYITGEHNNIIRYDNAFGDGIHFEITLQRSGFKKEIVIEAKNKLELPPTANHKLVALFEYSGQGLKIKSNDKLREWNKTDFFEENDGFRLQEETNEIYQSFIRPAYIVDDGKEVDNIENIKVFWKLHNGKLFQAKVLPTQFLKDAVYPVRADTTTNYYVGSGDGWAYYNADSGGQSQAKWDTALAATSCNSVDYAGASHPYSMGATQLSATIFRLGRGFFPVDTSGLPDGASISAASFFVYISSIVDGNTAYSYSGLIQTSQASPTSLVTGDWDQVGAVTTDTIAYDDMTSAAYNELILDATGISWIEKTGYTKLGFRNGLDLEDQYITDKANYVGCYFSEQTGTSQDPYLEVVYTTGTNYTKELTDSTTLTDTIVKSAGKVLSDAVDMVDSVIKSTSKYLSNSITLVDVFAGSLILTKLLTEAIALNDAITKVTSKIVSETLSLVDTITKATSRVFSEVVTLVDSITSVMIYIKELIESINLVDTITKSTSRVFTETVTLVDTVIRTLLKVFTETVTLVSSVVASSIFYKTLIETISLIASIKTRMNGILTNFWSRDRRDTGEDDWSREDRDFM